MDPLKIKFDTFSLLEDIGNLDYKDLGVNNLIVIADRDVENDEVETKIILSGKDLIEASRTMIRAAEKSPQLATIITMTAAYFFASQKQKKL